MASFFYNNKYNIEYTMDGVVLEVEELLDSKLHKWRKIPIKEWEKLLIAVANDVIPHYKKMKHGYPAFVLWLDKLGKVKI